MAAITSAAAAAIAAASPGESKHNNLLNKTQSIIQNMAACDGAFWEAALLAASFYHNHPLTTSLTEEEVHDWRFWLPMDLFEWRWKSDIQELFPWWEFTHTAPGHYAIEPDEYICPKETWEICKTTLRQPTFHTMYNLPNNSDKITYWDVFEQFSRKSTVEVASEMKKQHIHPEVKNFIIQRGCPKDLEEFIFCWAEKKSVLMMHWKTWAQKGIENYICKVTVETTGIALEKLKTNPPKLRRSATWLGKFYEGSDACPPRERIDQESDYTLIMAEVRAPKSLREWCSLKISGPKDNPMWKQKGLPAGLEWMIDVIWANLTPAEREELRHMLEYWRLTDFTVSIDRWLHIQLLHNFGDCFTSESKRKVNWMLTPRKATW